MANSFGGWALPHRLPIQSAPGAAANAGTSSFGMSGVNAHAVICGAGTTEAAAAQGLAPATWRCGLRCYVEVLVPLHPLLGTAAKVRCWECGTRFVTRQLSSDRPGCCALLPP